MQEEKHMPQQSNTFLANLIRTPILEAQPSIKNVHTATHLRILNNKVVLIVIDESIHVYSLEKTAEGMAPLINVVTLAQIFEQYNKQHYEDVITSVFRKAEKEDFSSQIFNEEQDPKSNILLNIANIKNRINFFNNNKIRVKTLETDSQGRLLLVLHDGRAAVLTHHNSNWNNHRYEAVNLNEITKEFIENGCFVSGDRDLISIIVSNKLLCIDLSERHKAQTYKVNFHSISKMHAVSNEKERLKVFIVCERQLHVIQIRKKKIFASNNIVTTQFINQSFFFHEACFLVQQNKIIKFDLNSLKNQDIAEFSQPCELTHIDEFGNFGKKSLKNNKQTLWLVESTKNGVYVGLTIRRQGNYKQGRLLIFQCPLSYYIQRLIAQVQSNREYIDTSDSIFIDRSKENKQILQQFASLIKKDSLEFRGTPMTIEQYNTVSINLGHAFEGRQIAKQKIIEKVLTLRFQKLIPLKKRLDYNELIERCCFSGTPLFDEDVVHCKDCDIFGIAGRGDKCVVCMRKMQVYQ